MPGRISVSALENVLDNDGMPISRHVLINMHARTNVYEMDTHKFVSNKYYIGYVYRNEPAVSIHELVFKKYMNMSIIVGFKWKW